MGPRTRSSSSGDCGIRPVDVRVALNREAFVAPFSFFGISVVDSRTSTPTLSCALGLIEFLAIQYIMVPSFMSVWSLLHSQRVQYLETTHERIHSKDGRTNGSPREQQTKKTTLHNFISASMYVPQLLNEMPPALAEPFLGGKPNRKSHRVTRFQRRGVYDFVLLALWYVTCQNL